FRAIGAGKPAPSLRAFLYGNATSSSQCQFWLRPPLSRLDFACAKSACAETGLPGPCPGLHRAMPDEPSGPFKAQRGPVFQLHAEGQAAGGQDFLDLVQRLATQVWGLEQFV